ncbi:MAG: DUF4358 domain-containing protein [Solobacterium sp.]|nr:DUF4358 domain-containing protein [Solobacterium sp.]
MLKKFVSSLLCLMFLVGCGSAGAANASASSEAEKIVKELNLSDKMDTVESRIIKGLFFFEEGTLTDSSVYIANDKSADIVAVFQSEDTAAIKEKVDAYLVSAKEQMQNYYPDEVFKIDNAIVEEGNGQVILIVTNDIESARKTARSILE